MLLFLSLSRPTRILVVLTKERHKCLDSPLPHRVLPIVLLIPVSLMLCMAIANATEIARPDKAPTWLYEAETYGSWYSDQASEEEIRPYHAFPFIGWTQPCSNQKWIKEFHNSGIRSIAYVSFYKAPAIPEVEDRRRWEGGSPGVRECKRNPFWQAVDLSNHPDWRLIGENGEVKRPFNNPEYPPGWSQVCTNVEGYSEAVLRGVRGIMDLGFDGLFIDNVHPEVCFGPERGKHKHVHADKNNPETYKMLLAQVRRLVKSYGDDKVCVLNSGDLREEMTTFGVINVAMYSSVLHNLMPTMSDSTFIFTNALRRRPLDSSKALFRYKVVPLENRYCLFPHNDIFLNQNLG